MPSSPQIIAGRKATRLAHYFLLGTRSHSFLGALSLGTRSSLKTTRGEQVESAYLDLSSFGGSPSWLLEFVQNFLLDVATRDQTITVFVHAALFVSPPLHRRTPRRRLRFARISYRCRQLRIQPIELVCKHLSNGIAHPFSETRHPPSTA